MRIAIVGAGLSGLSIATYLLRKNKAIHITIFDKDGIGKGASCLASLLHPYPGKHGKRSLYAGAALFMARELFKFAEKFADQPFVSSGILRSIYTLEQEQNFISMGKLYGDVHSCPNGMPFFHISSGFTINTTQYLQSLWRFCKKHNATFICQKIDSLEELINFDHIVLAMGSGIQKFDLIDNYSFDFVKGQILYSNIKSICHIPMSCIAKGYIAQVPNSNIHLGSSYEHNFTQTEFSLEKAQENIIEKLITCFPWVKELSISGGHAAIRVCNKRHYFPVFDKISPGLWMMTAMGSRGLLYHALMGFRGAEQILSGWI